MNNFPGYFDPEHPPRLYVRPATLWSVPVAPLEGDHDFPTVTISKAKKEEVWDWRLKIVVILGLGGGIAFGLTNRNWAAILRKILVDNP